MPHYLWREYNWLRVTAQCAVGVYACVFTFRLCYGPVMQHVNGIPMWPPKKKEAAILIIRAWLCTARAGWCLMNSLWKTWPCSALLYPSFQHTWLLSVDKTSGQVRGHVISIIMFLLRKYLYQGLPPSFSASTAEYFTALSPDKCPSQGFFPFVSRWRLLSE